MDLCIFPSSFLRPCRDSHCLLLPETTNLNWFLPFLDTPYSVILLCVVGQILSPGTKHTHDNPPELFNLSVSLPSILGFLIPLLEEHI